MTHYDGKGFHPTIRPQQPNRRKDRAKLKVVAKPTLWQLAMMRIGALAVEDNAILLGKLIESGALFANETTQIGPMSGGEGYGTIGDYSMQYADPSRPPPQEQIVNTGNEEHIECIPSFEETPTRNYGIFHRLQKHLFCRLLFLLPFMTVAVMASACHKKYDSLIEWDWDVDGAWAPPKEIIKAETDKRDVENVIIKLTYANCTGFPPGAFHRARDTLQTRINIAPNQVKLSGRIFVNSQNGAHLPPIYEPGHGSGMSLEDSIWYTSHGCTVQRLHQR